MERLNSSSAAPGTERDTESRPDWDPYSVWLTHIMRTPQQDADTPAGPESGDAGWNPYNVWQSMIKG